MHATMEDFCTHLRLEGNGETARGYSCNLRLYQRWLDAQGIETLHATREDLWAFQRYLAEEYRSSKSGQPLARSTQGTILSAITTYYRWLEQWEHVIASPAEKLQLPRVTKGQVRADFLNLQEATALLQTQYTCMQRYAEGSFKWAKECRGLALLCVAIATGRRRAGIRSLRLENADFQCNEIRCEREKGKAGRVLPVAAWAMDALKLYVEQARRIFDFTGACPYLFVGDHGSKLGSTSFETFLAAAHQETVAANPDLTELAEKKLSPHSLRVTFAHLLFEGACSIRSINELMMHESLSTTARYTPVPIESLREVALAAHPRA